jgi:hypothetical protein
VSEERGNRITGKDFGMVPRGPWRFSTSVAELTADCMAHITVKRAGISEGCAITQDCAILKNGFESK